MKTFYIPENITEDYCYILPFGDYYELYNTNKLSTGQSITYYRFYNSLEKDLYTTHTEVSNIDLELNTIQIIPSHSMLTRQDIPEIIFTTGSILLFIVIIINIITSMIKRGGIFSGLL